MPIQRCVKDGKPGYKYGLKGYCYTYNPNDAKSQAQALKKAQLQGAAIKASKSK